MRLASLLSFALALLSLRSGLYFDLGDSALLMDQRLRPLAAPGVYSQASPLGDTGYFMLREKQSGYCLLADSAGNPLSEPLFEDIKLCGEGIAVKYADQWALSDRALNRLTGFSYSAVFPAGDKYFAFRTNLWDDKSDELLILDASGREKSTGVYLLYADLVFSDGLCACCNGETGRYGYLDSEGMWVGENNYLWAGSYVSGLAAVRTQDGSGVIDTRGDWILSPIYEQLTLSERYVICRDKGGALIVFARTSSGLIMLRNLPGAHVAQVGEYLSFYTDEYVYLLASDGRIRAVFTGDTLLYEGFGTQVIASDRNGMYVYDAETGSMSEFSFTKSRLKHGDLYAFSRTDEDGSLRFGVMTADYDVLLEAEYDYVSASEQGVLAARDGKTVTLYKRDGDQVIRLTALTLP